MCPYYNESHKTCEFYGNYQDNRDSTCLTSDYWRRCANYTNRSFEEKVAKQVRKNPDL